MTANHPTIDTVADYRAGLLPASAQASVGAHLDGCAECAAASDAVAEVSRLLADSAADAVPMPADVVSMIDRALLAAPRERTSEVVPLNRPSTAAAGPAPRRSWPLLAAVAAAAAVVVGGAAIANSDLFDSTAESSAASDTSVERATAPSDAAGGQAEGPGGGALDGGAAGDQQDHLNGKHQAAAPSRLQSLLPSNLSAYATGITRSSGQVTPVRKTCAPVRVPEGDVVSGVRWRGAPAILLVDTAKRVAEVYDCGTASKVLFRTDY